MLSPQEQEELMQLCWEHQYGTLDSQESSRLEKLILSQDDARDFFVQYAGMCANLEWEGIVEPGPLGRSTSYDPLPSGELRTLPNYLRTEHKTRGHHVLLTVVTVFSLCLLGSAYLIYSHLTQPEPVPFLARITKTQNAVWSSDQRNWSQNDLIQTGDQLHLEQGMIELETASGAQLILKGRSLLSAVSTDEYRFDEGNLFAYAPPSAQGLTVETPTSRIVDLGTRFGVVVNPDQETEVHVLKGLVEFNQLNANRETTVTQKLTEKTAIRVQPHSKSITQIDSAPEMFVQSLVVDEPQIVASWRLNDRTSATTAQDSGDHHLDLQIQDQTGRSPFSGKPAPQNSSTSAGPFTSQTFKLFRTLNESETALFDMQRFTISLWARNPSQKLQADSATLFHYRNTSQHSTSQFNLYADGNSGRLGFGFLDTDNQYQSWGINKKILWQKDRWYHIVFTYDANTKAPNDSIVTYTRTPEFSSTPDLQQTFTGVRDILPLSPGGILAIGGSTLNDIPRHWGGEISDVRFIRGIPDRFVISSQ